MILGRGAWKAKYFEGQDVHLEESFWTEHVWHVEWQKLMLWQTPSNKYNPTLHEVQFVVFPSQLTQFALQASHLNELFIKYPIKQ